MKASEARKITDNKRNDCLKSIFEKVHMLIISEANKGHYTVYIDDALDKMHHLEEDVIQKLRDDGYNVDSNNNRNESSIRVSWI